MISGKQGSGKSSLSLALSDYLTNSGKKIFNLKFADPVYALHDVVLEKARELGLPITKDPDGALLQLLGTDWGRNTVGPSIWVNYTLKQCKLQQWRDIIIIDDLRMKNEFMFADGQCDKIIRIRLECPEEIRKQRRGPKWRLNTQHQSEIDLDDWVSMFDLVLDTEKQSVEDCLTAVRGLIAMRI